MEIYSLHDVSLWGLFRVIVEGRTLRPAPNKSEKNLGYYLQANGTPNKSEVIGNFDWLKFPQVIF